MAKTYINICRHCGEPFEAGHITTMYCPKIECQMSKAGHSDMPTVPPPHEDMPLGFIAWVMHNEKITWKQYAKDRQLYIKLYAGKTIE